MKDEDNVALVNIKTLSVHKWRGNCICSILVFFLEFRVNKSAVSIKKVNELSCNNESISQLQQMYQQKLHYPYRTSHWSCSHHAKSSVIKHCFHWMIKVIAFNIRCYCLFGVKWTVASNVIPNLWHISDSKFIRIRHITNTLPSITIKLDRQILKYTLRKYGTK